MESLRPAALLDRDGTLNVRPTNHRYIRSADDFAWLDGAAEGAARLAKRGYVLAVVSNQRGVARNLVSATTLRAIEELVQEGLRPFGVRIESFRYCPHDLNDACACRKPAPGLLLETAGELGLDLGRSWMIGDDDTDVLAGRAAGCKTGRVGLGHALVEADLAAPSLFELSLAIPVAEPHRDR